ncbi:hypothetical protein G6F22_017804 [Rhizopus arrhizus]|nr:hypothetical protein G6F22_017804 [Rhizopus arrhizus]
MDTSNVDAIVLSACVQMPSLPAIAKVEAQTGKPVITAAVATTYAILKSLNLEPVANGIRQHYLRYGGAHTAGRDAVVIVPGITSPAITWGFVGERFGKTFDTYILDVRGRGLSEAGTALDYSLDAQAADVLAFAQALGLERYSLVGHSMGGRIGVRAGRTRPAGLRRLVLVDPPVSGPGRRPSPAQLPG